MKPFSKFLLPCLVSLAAMTAQADPGASFDRLEQVARKSLTRNIATTRSGSYLAAGQHQFRGLWTRDFCFASPGLVALGRTDVLRSHLELVLRNTRSPDGLVPRYLDHYNTALRYAALTAGILLPIKDPLRPNFAGGSNQGVVADSNALVLLTALRYLDSTGDLEWWNRFEPTLVKIFHFYDKDLVDGLVRQGPFADWQDSARREGFTFYVNVLYWAATKRLVGFPAFGVTQEMADQLGARILARFKDPVSGLYASVLGKRNADGDALISLDGLLLALDLGLVSPSSPEGQQLYSDLRHHKLWRVNGGMPGAATWPEYDRKDIQAVPRATGMAHYHDNNYWSWLMALAAKVTWKLGDTGESDRILAELERLSVRDGWVGEIYRPQAELPLLNSRIYKAEKPFSWGSGLVLDALATRHRR